MKTSSLLLARIETTQYCDINALLKRAKSFKRAALEKKEKTIKGIFGGEKGVRALILCFNRDSQTICTGSAGFVS